MCKRLALDAFREQRCLPSIVIASRRLSGSSGLLEREAVLFYETQSGGVSLFSASARKSRGCDRPSCQTSSEQVTSAPSHMGSKFIRRVGVEDTCVPQKARVHRAGYGLWPSSLPGRLSPCGVRATISI